jgi:magnesium transporter
MSEQREHVHNDKLLQVRSAAHGDGLLVETTTSGLGGDVLEIEQAVMERLPVQADGVTTCLLFQSHKTPQAVTLADLPELVTVDDNFVWIDVSGVSVETMQQVAQSLQLHEHAVQHTLAAWKRPQLALFARHFFVTMTLPRLDARSYRVEAQKIAFFVGRNFLVSVHQHVLPFAPRVLQRATQNPHLVEYDSALMLFILLDELLEYYEFLKEQVQSQIELMEEHALTTTSNEFLSDLLHFKRYVFALSQLAGQHRTIFTAFLRPDFKHVSGRPVESYYRDLEVRHSRLDETFLGARDSVNTIFDIYISHVSHVTNSVMKTLTIVSTVLLPAALIIGFFSTVTVQNFPLLLTLWGFVVMVLSIATSTTVILWIFHHKGWLWN